MASKKRTFEYDISTDLARKLSNSTTEQQALSVIRHIKNYITNMRDNLILYKTDIAHAIETVGYHIGTDDMDETNYRHSYISSPDNEIIRSSR